MKKLLTKGLLLAVLVPTVYAETDHYYQIREADISLPKKRFRHLSFKLGDGSIGVFGGLGAPTKEAVFLINPNLTKIETLPAEAKVWKSYYNAGVGLINGNVLIINGGIETVYDYKTKTMKPTLNGLESEYIRWPTLTPLSYGLVLASGGDSDDFKPLSFWAIYDPQQNKFTTFGQMAQPRTNHTATELEDGRILIVGGDQTEEEQNYSTAEILDLSTGQSTLLTARTAFFRLGHAAMRLDSGQVLLVGGQGYSYNRDCELFDPTTMTFKPTGSMGIGRNESYLWKCGTDVLVMGGRGDSRIVEIYDEKSGQFSLNPELLCNPRQSGFALVPISSTTALAIGGSANDSGTTLNNIDILTRIDSNSSIVRTSSKNAPSSALDAIVHIYEKDELMRTLPISNFSVGEKELWPFQGDHPVCCFITNGVADCRAPRLEVSFSPFCPYEEQVALLNTISQCKVPSIHVIPHLSAEELARWDSIEDLNALLPTKKQIEAVFPPLPPPADLHYTVEEYDPERDPAQDLKDAIKIASNENRHILLQVGGNWCSWCTAMSEYFHDTRSVRNCLAENYLIMKVNVSTENQNENFLSAYPPAQGYPHLFILDSKGKLLHSQPTGDLEDGGDCYSETIMLELLEKWAPSPTE